MDSELPKISIIVPVYNEQGAIEQTAAGLLETMERSGLDFEILLIDDGSYDDSLKILERLHQEHHVIRVIRHERNRGYGAALKTGLRAARSDVIVVTDADGTYPLDRLPELVDAIEGVDMVVGARTADNVEESPARTAAKTMLGAYASWLARRPIPDINSGFRVFRKHLAEKFFYVLPDGFSFTTTITLAMLTNGYQVTYVPIDYAKRVGRSKIRPLRDFLNFAQLIIRTGIYFAPLRVLFPLIVLLIAAFLTSACYDIFVLSNLTDKTLLLLFLAMNTLLFALLADMIDKRSGR